MSYATTKELLSLESDEALAIGLRERIEGKRGDPPVHDDWTWTEAVSRAAAMAREEPIRSRFAAAVTRLFDSLLREARPAPGAGEWPAGVLRVAQQVAWTDAEKGVITRYLAGLLVDVRDWPLGEPSAPGLGSPTLELFRALRRVSTRCLQGAEARVATKRLLDGPATEDADMELGAIVGLLASYADADASVFWPLRELRGERRDRVLFAVDREFVAWAGDARRLARPLLDQFDEYNEAGQPTMAEQRWVGQAVGRLGDPDDPSVQKRVRRLCEPAPPPARIKAPDFIARPS